MKQLIVLIATVILGISLSGTVLGMGGNVKDLASSATSQIGSAFHASGSAIDVNAAVQNAGK